MAHNQAEAGGSSVRANRPCNLAIEEATVFAENDILVLVFFLHKGEGSRRPQTFTSLKKLTGTD
jgi:hypothetical protein